MGYNIAIDGPAGAGKSTIAKRVAKELGYIYVDTGAMYRAMAVYFRERGLTSEDLERMKEVCTDAEIVIRYENGSQQVYLNGENVTGKLREEAIGRLASVGSALPEVRAHLLELQRKLARDYDVVMDGRDIGTNILPQADAKIYLTASVRTRAERRFKELREAGQPCILEEIEKDISERDERDMTRETAPLRQAEDAVLVDSSEMTIDEVVQAILDVCR
nr:(d)CMP kinase [uncultured Faecalimonas sp.]